MFTGIIKALAPVVDLEKQKHLLRYAIRFPSDLLQGLECGGSVSVDGVCQTVVSIEKEWVWFEAINETMRCTTLSEMRIGRCVNVERSARWGDEIGGHLLSGHVYGVAPLFAIVDNVYTFECSPLWMKYFFTKGFIAIDGISLTLASVNREHAHVSVHLIPETIKRTTLGFKPVGTFVNIELDSQTQVIVETLEKMNL